MAKNQSEKVKKGKKEDKNQSEYEQEMQDYNSALWSIEYSVDSLHDKITDFSLCHLDCPRKTMFIHHLHSRCCDMGTHCPEGCPIRRRVQGGGRKRNDQMT